MIQLDHVKKSYKDVTPLEDINAVIREGEVVAVIGPSGTGKSTLLRLISMLETPTSGKIFIDGDEITAKGADLALFRRKMGMVFQDFKLFPHLTVLENVMKAPMDVLGLSREEAKKIAVEKITAVGLDGRYEKYPHQLSGGQKQRIAIARTLAMDPEIIFFDEPTSALDPAMTGEVESIIHKIVDGKRILMVVTHDMRFAKEISTRVFYMDRGEIYEDGPPEQIFENPQKDLTKAFIKKKRSVDIELFEEESDLAKCFADISEFCYKNRLPRKTAYYVESVFEEVCTQILAGRHRQILLSYEAESKTPLLEVEYSGEKVDISSSNLSLSKKIIEAFVKNISQEEGKDGKGGRLSFEIRSDG